MDVAKRSDATGYDAGVSRAIPAGLEFCSNGQNADARSSRPITRLTSVLDTTSLRIEAIRTSRLGLSFKHIS
jgi:hypothetical protein